MAFSSKGMAGYVSKRGEQMNAKSNALSNGNTFKALKPDEHFSAISNHIGAAHMVKDIDHESAADHLKKAAVHADAAGEYFDKHSDKWIQGAIKHKGAFTEKAKRAGKTIKQEEISVLKKGSKASPTTKKQAVLAKTLRGFSKKVKHEIMSREDHGKTNSRKESVAGKKEVSIGKR